MKNNNFSPFKALLKKKNILALSIILICQGLVMSPICSQVSIPKNLLKGIKIESDEFTKITIYSNGSGLFINQTKDYAKLYFEFQTFTWDVPMELQKIYILTQDSLYVINSGFTVTETSVRGIGAFHSGILAALAYDPDKFDTKIRIAYIYSWIGDAKYNMNFINSMIKCDGAKVRFEGKNQSNVIIYDDKDIKNMKAMLVLYQYLKDNSTLKY